MLDFEIGDIIAGKYEIKQVLGAGGMGKVYRARQVDLGRDVALKVPSAQVLQSPDIMARFMREAKTVAKLTHDNIVQVYEYFHEGDLAFIAMEYVEGKDLKDFVLAPPPDLSVGDLSRILELSCEGLEHAHEHGIVHRDIKPHNIMVARLPRGKWRVKVMDFGIAHIDNAKQYTEMGGQLTQTGQALGTPSYMAPEQIRGSGISHLSDLYSFGCVIYYVFSRETVFTGSGLTVAVSHLNEPPPSIRSRNPALPSELDALILQCLEKDPSKRFQHASEIGQALQQCMSALRSKPMAEFWRLTSASDNATIPIIQTKGLGSTGTENDLIPVRTDPTIPQQTGGSTKPTQGDQTISVAPRNEGAYGRSSRFDVEKPTSTSTPAGGPTPTYGQRSSSPLVQRASSAATATGDAAPSITPTGGGMSVHSPTTPSTPYGAPAGGASRAMVLAGVFIGVCAIAGVVIGVKLSSNKKKNQGGNDPNNTAVVTASPTPTRTTTAADPSPAPTPEPTPEATPGPTPTPSPIPTPTPHPVLSRLVNFTQDAKNTKGIRNKVRIWATVAKMAGETQDSMVLERVWATADAIALDIALAPDMVQIPQSSFTMGRKDGGNVDEQPEHNVRLNSYSIGVCEVTALEFSVFLNENRDRAEILYPALSELAKPEYNVRYDEKYGRYLPNPGKELHPANGVSWKAADEYTTWLVGKSGGRQFRLPTEAEWESAARGSAASAYPWGESEPGPTQANYHTRSTAEVTDFENGASLNGCLNMAGNVAEWVSDWYDSSIYGSEPTRDNPKGPLEPPNNRAKRCLRGGGYDSPPNELPSYRRGNANPEKYDPTIGFRLALSG